jgi:hypothetical protein
MDLTGLATQLGINAAIAVVVILAFNVLRPNHTSKYQDLADSRMQLPILNFKFFSGICSKDQICSRWVSASVKVVYVGPYLNGTLYFIENGHQKSVEGFLTGLNLWLKSQMIYLFRLSVGMLSCSLDVFECFVECFMV